MLPPAPNCTPSCLVSISAKKSSEGTSISFSITDSGGDCDRRELLRPARRRQRPVERAGADAGAVHRQHELLGRERARVELLERRSVVVAERGQLPAEVGDVRAVRGGRPSAERVEQRGVADHPPGDSLDPVVGELADELARGRAVAVLPVAVEAAVAERRIAAADQVQVPVPDAAGTEVAGADDLRLQPGARAELLQRRDRRVQLLDRRRRPADARPQREQGRLRGQVVDHRAARRARLSEQAEQRGPQRDELRRRRRLGRGGSVKLSARRRRVWDRRLPPTHPSSASRRGPRRHTLRSSPTTAMPPTIRVSG